MLYTTKEIAQMYGGEQQNITPYMITHTWVPRGLKHVRGKRNVYLFKKEWVEDFLEKTSSNIENETNKLKRVRGKKIYLVS